MKKSRFNETVSCGNRHIIVNTMTASIIELNDSEWNSYKSLSLPLDLERILEEQGMLVDEQLDEIGLLRNAFHNAQMDKQSARFTLCPTLDCNFKCPYCYEKRIPGKMSVATQELVLQDISRIIRKDIQEINVTWYGGEPLLYPTIIQEMSKSIISISKEQNIKYNFGIITNGYLINQKTIDLFNSIKMKNIQITIDGDEKTHNSRRKLKNDGPTFKTIEKHVRMLDSEGFSVTIRVNLDKQNIHLFSYVKELFSECKNIRCIPAFVTEEVLQCKEQKRRCYHHKEYQNQIEFLKLNYDEIDIERLLAPQIGLCTAEHEFSFVYGPDGNVYKCINDVCSPEYALYNLYDNIDSRNPIVVSKYLGRDVFTEFECNECAYLPLCYGRCVWEYQEKKTHACPEVKYILKDILKHKYLGKEVTSYEN